MGFSAGGHLAVAAATQFESRKYNALDQIDDVSCRPDFAISVYPGYLKAREKDALAPEIRIPAKTPPIFLVHGDDDPISPAIGSVLLYSALRQAGISAELHIYAKTVHDFGVRRNTRPYSKWTENCTEWLQNLGFLGK